MDDFVVIPFRFSVVGFLGLRTVNEVRLGVHSYLTFDPRYAFLQLRTCGSGSDASLCPRCAGDFPDIPERRKIMGNLVPPVSFGRLSQLSASLRRFIDGDRNNLTYLALRLLPTRAQFYFFGDRSSTDEMPVGLALFRDSKTGAMDAHSPPLSSSCAPSW